MNDIRVQTLISSSGSRPMVRVQLVALKKRLARYEAEGLAPQPVLAELHQVLTRLARDIEADRPESYVLNELSSVGRRLSSLEA